MNSHKFDQLLYACSTGDLAKAKQFTFEPFNVRASSDILLKTICKGKHFHMLEWLFTLAEQFHNPFQLDSILNEMIQVIDDEGSISAFIEHVINYSVNKNKKEVLSELTKISLDEPKENIQEQTDKDNVQEQTKPEPKEKDNVQEQTEQTDQVPISTENVLNDTATIFKNYEKEVKNLAGLLKEEVNNLADLLEKEQPEQVPLLQCEPSLYVSPWLNGHI